MTEAVVFQVPADFQARCAAKNRRIADGEAMTIQQLSDALGLPFEFVAAAVAITEVLMTGQPVLIDPAPAGKAN